MVLSLAWFIAVNVAVRFIKTKDHRLSSYLLAMPMLSPLVIYALNSPQLDILVMEKGSQAFSFPPDPMTFVHMHPVPPVMQNLLSLTGSLCISGLLLGLSLLTLCLVLNRFGTKRGFIPLTVEDYPRTLSFVAKRCRHFGINMPQIGLFEDLRPNPFVGGHGRSSCSARVCSSPLTKWS